ncbi:hypothetical protein F5Y13DRAFT_199018 [Hypoxylon sp. FL1857]|nr:hypothetical protein F5Y13DRAFT_199018 [Hypoxylon sp. FL1857]
MSSNSWNYDAYGNPYYPTDMPNVANMANTGALNSPPSGSRREDAYDAYHIMAPYESQTFWTDDFADFPYLLPDTDYQDFGSLGVGPHTPNPFTTNASADLMTGGMGSPQLSTIAAAGEPIIMSANNNNNELPSIEPTFEETLALWDAIDEARLADSPDPTGSFTQPSSLDTQSAGTASDSNQDSQQQEPASHFEFNQTGQEFDSQFEFELNQIVQGFDVTQDSQLQEPAAHHDINQAIQQDEPHTQLDFGLTMPPMEGLAAFNSGLTMPQVTEPAADTMPPVQQLSTATIPTAPNTPVRPSAKGKKRASGPSSTQGQVDGATEGPQKKRRIVRADSCEACREQKVRCEPQVSSRECTRCQSRGIPCNVNRVDKRTNRTKSKELQDTIADYHGLVQEFLATLYILSPKMIGSNGANTARDMYRTNMSPSLIVQGSGKLVTEWVKVPSVPELERYRKGYRKLEDIREAIRQVHKIGLRLLGQLIHACAMAYHKAMAQETIDEILRGAERGNFSHHEILQAENTQESQDRVKQLYAGKLKPWAGTLEVLPKYPSYA